MLGRNLEERGPRPDPEVAPSSALKCRPTVKECDIPAALLPEEPSTSESWPLVKMAIAVKQKSTPLNPMRCSPQNDRSWQNYCVNPSAVLQKM